MLHVVVYIATITMISLGTGLYAYFYIATMLWCSAQNCAQYYTRKNFCLTLTVLLEYIYLHQNNDQISMPRASAYISGKARLPVL